MSTERECLKNKKRIVIKVGSSTITHPETRYLDLRRTESLARVITDLTNSDREVALVSSGAIAVGRHAMHINRKPRSTAEKQALAAIGQAQLIMAYERIFATYNQDIAQLLLTKDTILRQPNRDNARNTFMQLFNMGVVPIINENDTVATHEIEFGDNDRLSAIVSSLVDADLLIILTDFDGLYTADPHKDPTATRIPLVKVIDDSIIGLASGDSSSGVGTGGMATKVLGARMATNAGADVVIANGSDPMTIHRILEGEDIGTLFLAHKSDDFDLIKFIEEY